jgi:hypothetical protein
LISPILFIILRIALFLVGMLIAFSTFISAIRTFVLPRRAPDFLNRSVFIIIRRLFDLRITRTSSYERKDRVMELYAPITLISLLITWLICIQFGYMVMYWAINMQDLFSDFSISGSSLLTLGFRYVENLPSTILIFSEATIGLILIAILISYLPTIYTAFSRREAAVTALEIRAGSPPSPITIIKRYTALKRLQSLGEIWSSWEVWFIDVEESHTSLSVLPFFRSPQSHRSWVGAAGAVLDGAALTLACLDIPRDTQADLCIRAGYLALRSIASVFGIDFDPDPAPDDPISVTRAEFDVAWDEMQRAGVPLKADQDQAWLDFAGWRVNYDRVLLALAELTIIPYTPWISDRYLANAPVTLLRWRKIKKQRQRQEWFSPSNIP